MNLSQPLTETVQPLKTAEALRYHKFGDPFETLSHEPISIDPPEPGFVTLKILAAPINPADFGRINGTYGKLSDLPGTGGIEGVGEVVDTGSKNGVYSIGTRVLFSGEPSSWQTYALANEGQVYPAPDTLDDLQASMFWVNPATAWRMMHDFARLEPGDWIVQNAATSAVGKLVIQFASQLGVKTANLVRDPEAAEGLLNLGANIVLKDDKDAAKQFQSQTGSSSVKLGLNAVGGNSALTICKCLSNKATLVTYGGMDRQPATFPTRYLIFNDLSLRGFWVSEWYRNASRATIEGMHAEIAEKMEAGNIRTEIEATYSLEDWREALEHSLRPGKTGKVVFHVGKSETTESIQP